MRSEIKINNSRLKIVPLEADSSRVVVLRSKKCMKYQEVVMTGPSGYTTKSTVGLGKFTLDPITSGKFPEVWALEVSKTKYSDIEYTDSEVKVIVSFLGALVPYYQDTAELLSHCTGDRNIIEGFYSAYGRKGILEYQAYLKEMLARWDKYKPDPIEEREYPRSYDRNRYSVQRLIADLVEDKASILTDKYLIGEYQRISQSGGTWESKSAINVSDEWFPITGYLGNQTRANLSIVYKAKVKVSIPPNPYGIGAGLHDYNTTKAMCLIKDGILNQSLLGVKISSGLAGKLKRLGIVRGGLLCKDEYFIDISTIPVISKSWIRGFNSISMSRLEIKLALSKVALEYMGLHDTGAGKVKDPRTDFLESLGIYGSEYRGKFITKPEGEYYNTIELVSNITGIPKTQKDRLGLYKEFKDTGKCKNKVIDAFLRSLGTITPDTKKVWKEKHSSLTTQLRDRKFQMIMSKKTRFEEPGQPFIDDVHKSVEIFEGVKVNVSWSFLKKRVYV